MPAGKVNVDTMSKVQSLSNGHANGHVANVHFPNWHIANGHANGHANGYTNVHVVENGIKKSPPASKKPAESGPCFEEDHEEADEQNSYTYEVVKEVADYLLTKTDIKPQVGIICGSGLGSLAETLTSRTAFPYEAIPHFPVSSVPGHAGQLVFGILEGIPVICMQGRFHYYEGYPLWKCCMPVRVMKLLGIKILIATNAAGGLNANYKTGDIMILKDHVNMMGFAGNNPLRGANEERFGPRFVAMNRAYDTDLIKLAKNVADEMNITSMVHEGVYTCLGGPCFETVAELKLLKILGVDAVGMSTVHEVITAVHCGLKCFAFSLITNECITDYESDKIANHEEVMDTAKMRTNILQTLVSEFIKRLPV